MRLLSLVIWVLCFFPFILIAQSQQPAAKQKLPQLQIIETPILIQSEIAAIRDSNGKFCAALQFVSDMNGFSYQAYNGVVKLDDQPGKDMVYIQSSERVVEILKNGYELFQLILSEYGIQLEEQKVWQIKITGDIKTDSINIVINTEPYNAHVYLDNIYIGQQKLCKVIKGLHQIRIFKEGYDPLIQEIYVTNENILFSFQMEPILDDEEIEFTSEEDLFEILLQESQTINENSNENSP